MSIRTNKRSKQCWFIEFFTLTFSTFFVIAFDFVLLLFEMKKKIKTKLIAHLKLMILKKRVDAKTYSEHWKEYSFMSFSVFFYFRYIFPSLQSVWFFFIICTESCIYIMNSNESGVVEYRDAWLWCKMIFWFLLFLFVCWHSLFSSFCLNLSLKEVDNRFSFIWMNIPNQKLYFSRLYLLQVDKILFLHEFFSFDIPLFCLLIKWILFSEWKYFILMIFLLKFHEKW